MAGGYRVSADIGGTFTDIACLSPQGELTTHKAPSTPHDYAEAIMTGLSQLTQQLGLGQSDIAEVLHASTVATNAILEGKGARTALVTTAGFRDVLELRRIRVPRLYEPLYEKPAPLVPRRLRFEVPERMNAQGEVLKALDPGAVERLADRLASLDLEAVAICFLHAHVNPAHERLAARILRERLPRAFLSVSSEVLPEIREYERTSTTVANAYVAPPIVAYLRSLADRLKAAGVDGRLMMMQSSGGALDVESVIAKPATMIESGPAAGVIGAAQIGARSGYRNLITFDMGGTTAKASLIEDGIVASTNEYEVGGGLSLANPLVKGGGYALKLPVIDVSEVGAGGGSLVRVDVAGAVKVGPQSAGASPGPACYGRGGLLPTVTDANVALGYLNPEALAGGTVPIDVQAAGRALAEHVASRLGRDVLEAAYGAHRLANVAMMRAVKAVSTYRGRDPRDFTLFAFGGNGGVHAAALARELDMRRIVVPPAAGVFSAVGLLYAPFEVSRSAAFIRLLDEEAVETMAKRLLELEREALAQIDDARAASNWRADLRYVGQAFELRVDFPREVAPSEALAAIKQRFEAEHRRAYGHALEAEAIQCVALTVVASVAPAAPPRLRVAAPASGALASRPVYFGPHAGLLETPVIARAALPSDKAAAGPLIVEEYDCTTVVPPDAAARRDDLDNIVIELRGGFA